MAGRGDRGEAATQLVLLTPALLVLLLAVVQLALWFHAANLATATANRAVSAAAPLGATARAGRVAAATFAADAGAVLTSPPVVERSATTVRAEVRVRLPRVLPGLPGSVTRSVSAPVERFIPEAQR